MCLLFPALMTVEKNIGGTSQTEILLSGKTIYEEQKDIIMVSDNCGYNSCVQCCFRNTLNLLGLG
jgi:hypothetical protein